MTNPSPEGKLTAMSDLRSSLDRVIDYCRAGFATYDSGYYARIDEAMADVEQTKEVQKIRSLAKFGPTLSSPRFAYPHIEDTATSLRAATP